ncbi:hypothetical protein GCM10023149_30440 [Mucilaginibacter gynuensis]|uniref:Uncharacterized protein n=1 Tax=Mucilaginibacter gynuensis TaxID=1302236 RepID=A0ABP8GMY4_9SPHI
MNHGAGMNLNWYWQKWYFDKAIPDLAISKVIVTGQNCVVNVSNIGGAPVPVHLNIYYANGNMQTVSRNITVWQKNNRYDLKFKANFKIVKIILGDPYDTDIHSLDNVWTIGNKARSHR